MDYSPERKRFTLVVEGFDFCVILAMRRARSQAGAYPGLASSEAVEGNKGAVESTKVVGGIVSKEGDAHNGICHAIGVIL